MPRPALLPLVVLVALAGCGTERPGVVRVADATPSVTASPTPPPTPRSETGAGGSIADVPLAIGLPDRNEDDGSPVVVTDRPATGAFELCGRTVWDPHAGTTERLGVTFSGEAEWFRGRTLVSYPTADAASAAVDAALEAVTRCPQDPEGASGHTAHTIVDHDAGDQSFGWMDRYWSADVQGFDTGLTVYHVVRFGPAVLLTYEYAEGNGSEQSRQSALRQATRDDQPVVDELVGLPAGAPAQSP